MYVVMPSIKTSFHDKTDKNAITEKSILSKNCDTNVDIFTLIHKKRVLFFNQPKT